MKVAISFQEGAAILNGLRHSIKLYTRAGCHLCDDALALLRKHELDPALVDVDAECLLEFNECVPVVEIDGKIRFRGRVNEILLKRLLSAEDRT